MNDTTYTASILDAHRAEDLRHEVELRALRAQREADAAPRHATTAAGASAEVAASVPAHRFAWPHRSGRRAASVATR